MADCLCEGPSPRPAALTMPLDTTDLHAFSLYHYGLDGVVVPPLDIHTHLQLTFKLWTADRLTIY